jgi:hypothetical protein
MLRTRIRSWSRKVLALLGLVVVLPAWPIAKAVERLAGRFPDPIWLRGVLLFLSLLVVASVLLLSAMGPGAAIAVAFLLAGVSRWLFALPPDPYENTFKLQEYPRTRWRLCDPELSTRGLWRAEVNADLPDIAEPNHRQMLLHLVQELVGDWSFRSGWPYYHCRVLSATPSVPRRAGPFSSVADSSRVYRIRLDVGETGWIHFGDGYVEFQLEPRAGTQRLSGVPNLHRRPERPSRLELLLAENHPLWDRWLDR